jgi:uncharacterized protein (DUF305 family)
MLMLKFPLLQKLLVFAICMALVSVAYADAPVEGRVGRAEVRFMEGMIDHHQMALDMATDCLTQASSEDVLALCQAVIDAQTPEIELMQSWLESWYDVTYAPVAMAEMNDMSNHSMENMQTDPSGMMGMMAGLLQLEGTEYEIAWLESMIDHHDDAIHMSARLLARATNGHVELLELAQTIIDAQSAETELMEAMIIELTGQ